MEKISLNSTKLGELRFSVSEVDAPQVAIITQARQVAKRNDNGHVIENSVAKLNLSGIDIKLYQLMKQQGLDISSVVPITIEVVTDEATLKRYKVDELIGEIVDLRSAKVALKWVSRGNSGGWGGLKLILENIQIVQPKATN